LAARGARAAAGDAGDWFLDTTSPDINADRLRAFRQGLKENSRLICGVRRRPRSAAGGLPQLSIERSKSDKPNGSVYISHRATAEGGGPSGAIVTEPSLGSTDA
jgi:hypothetical protein